MISSEFVAALKALPADQHRVVAVAARSLQSAKEFATKHGIEKSYGSYTELTTDPDIGRVTVTLPNLSASQVKLATIDLSFFLFNQDDSSQGKVAFLKPPLTLFETDFHLQRPQS